jgi:hypothetical protein
MPVVYEDHVIYVISVHANINETQLSSPYSCPVIKTAEQEQQLRLAIRDEVARNPLTTVVQLQNAFSIPWDRVRVTPDYRNRSSKE